MMACMAPGLLMTVMLCSLPVSAQPSSGGGETVDPCASTTCGSGAHCVVQNSQSVCQCDQGFTSSSDGCVQNTACSDASDCGGDQYCLGKRCVDRAELDHYQKKGKTTLTVGLVVLSVGVLSAVLSIVPYKLTPIDECDGLFDLLCGGRDTDTPQFKAFLAMLYSGILVGLAGVITAGVGGGKVQRAKKSKKAHLTRLVPFLAPIPDGGMVGIGYLF